MIVFNRDRYKPDFGDIVISNCVNMRRLMDIRRVEAKFISFNIDSGHDQVVQFPLAFIT